MNSAGGFREGSGPDFDDPTDHRGRGHPWRGGGWAAGGGVTIERLFLAAMTLLVLVAAVGGGGVAWTEIRHRQALIEECAPFDPANSLLDAIR